MIYKSVAKVLKEGRYVTPDLGGTVTTNEMVKAIIGNL